MAFPLDLAHTVAEGIGREQETFLRVRRIAEFEALREQMKDDGAYTRVLQELDDLGEVDHDDLRWAHGVSGGHPPGTAIWPPR